MKVFLWLCIFFVAFFSKVTMAAECTIAQAVGKISGIEWDESEGSAYVIRAAPTANERIKVQAYQWLCENDRIEITDDTKVVIFLSNREQKTCTRHSSCVLPINANKITKEIPLFLFNKPITRPRHIPIFSIVRSIHSVSLENDPLLPSGIQYLPSDYEKAALLWRNGPAEVTLITSEQETRLHSGNKAYLIVELPKGQSNMRISLSDINWHIQSATIPPVPEEMNEFNSASLPDRLVRALLILKKGPNEWRLFALSELENLSHTGFFAAEELWHAVLSGELAEALIEN
ncbi:MAG: hypothetical protein KF888_08110 [Nitrosomonas sp.]|nr:hypothetical protein [Nitrosomonas sp.]